MSAETLLEQFGYLALFLGTILEGETFLVAAGFFASRAYLDLTMVTIVGFLGAYTGHVFWFWLGRRHGVRLLDRYPKMGRHLGRGIRVFERYGAGAVMVTQWLYGFRITCSVVIGMSRIPMVKFLLYQALSCALWVVAITIGGFYFGHLLETMLGRVAHLEKYGLAIIVVIALALWLNHRRREREREEGA